MAVGNRLTACVHFACKSEEAEQVYSRWQHKGAFCGCVGQTSALQRHEETLTNHLPFTFFPSPLIGGHFLMHMYSDIPWIDFKISINYYLSNYSILMAYGAELMNTFKTSTVTNPKFLCTCMMEYKIPHYFSGDNPQVSRKQQ